MIALSPIMLTTSATNNAGFFRLVSSLLALLNSSRSMAVSSSTRFRVLPIMRFSSSNRSIDSRRALCSASISCPAMVSEYTTFFSTASFSILLINELVFLKLAREKSMEFPYLPIKPLQYPIQPQGYGAHKALRFPRYVNSLSVSKGLPLLIVPSCGNGKSIPAAHRHVFNVEIILLFFRQGIYLPFVLKSCPLNQYLDLLRSGERYLLKGNSQMNILPVIHKRGMSNRDLHLRVIQHHIRK